MPERKPNEYGQIRLSDFNKRGQSKLGKRAKEGLKAAKALIKIAERFKAKDNKCQVTPTNAVSTHPPKD